MSRNPSLLSSPEAWRRRRSCPPVLVPPPAVVVVCWLVYLRLLLNGGVLATLAAAALAILLQVVVQNLRVGLLVRGQDVHEGGWSVAGGSRGVDGPTGPQRRGEAERSSRRPGMETLLFERLRLCVNRSRNVWHSCVA